VLEVLSVLAAALGSMERGQSLEGCTYMPPTVMQQEVHCIALWILVACLHLIILLWCNGGV
jgi:hypothetical protein